MAKGDDALEVEEPIEIDDADVDKAGFVIYGLSGDKMSYGKNQLCVVTGYTQNRYGNEPAKAYSLMKGSVDDGETPFQGGRRESEEESGISIKKLLGDDAYSELKKSVKNGKGDVKPKKPGGYPEIKVKRAFSNPTQFSYTSAAGKTKHMQMFFIELKDGHIDHLQPKLKRPPVADSQTYNEAAPELHFTAEKYVEQHHYPTLAEMLDVLMTGVVKPKESAPEGWPEEEATIIKKPDLPKLLKAMGVEDISCWKEKDWHAFCEKAKGDEPEKYKKVLKDIGKLKKFFKETELISEDGTMKFDGSDRPLTFFFEGAEVLPINHVIKRSAEYAAINAPYAEAMWGGKGAYVPPHENLTRERAAELAKGAQIAGFFPQANNQSLEASKHFNIDSAVDSIQAMLSGLRTLNAQEQVRRRVHGLAESLRGVQL